MLQKFEFIGWGLSRGELPNLPLTNGEKALPKGKMYSGGVH